MDLAELAAVGKLHGLLEVRHAAALGAGLEDAAEMAHRVGQVLAIGDGQPAGFLAVHILARLGREHRGRRVPAVAGGDQDGVDIGPGQQLAEIAIENAIVVLVVAVDQLLSRLAAAGLNVGDGHNLHVALGEHALEVISASGADADHPQRDPLARGRDTATTLGTRGDDGGKRESDGRGDRMLQ